MSSASPATWRAESSDVAVSRSSSARASASFGVRTAWPSFRPSSQIGYQIRSASCGDVGPAAWSEQDVDVGLRGELGPPVAADGDEGDAVRRGAPGRPASRSRRSQSSISSE